VDLAVRAARRAFDDGPWPRARASERIRVLRRVVDLVREHGDELPKLQALDNSVPLSFGSVYATSAGFVADVFDHHAGWVDKLAGETLPPYQGGDHMVFTLREPVGVVGAVVPWNAPAIESYIELKTVLLPTTDEMMWRAVGLRVCRGRARSLGTVGCPIHPEYWESPPCS
jgi:acyl-CoA reductase-like NAD-dependent aldehyde dehydrogenase